jgi:hypothetical protein
MPPLNLTTWIPQNGQGDVVNTGTVFLVDNSGNFLVDNSGNFLVTTPTTIDPKAITVWTATGL